MAVVIHHGPAGSYKSSSVVWFKILPALRAGRVVVTNVEGMYPLHIIEKQLGEKFPDTARLFRIFSQKEVLKDLWRRWFHWMPLGAMVVIDEVQDVYTQDKPNWKESDLDLKPYDYYSNILPPELYQLTVETHKTFKPIIDESTSDDTGELALDENGLVIYPPTMNEAFMRHRKFNWDLHFATPDITQVSKAVRAVAELAISYKSNDWFFLNKRKPRLFEHNPKRAPEPRKGDLVSTHKVPVDVHLLYKSTQTGQTTKSGQSAGLFSSSKVKLVLFVILPLALGSVGYFGYKSVSSHNKTAAPVHTVPSSQGGALSGQQVSYSTAGHASAHDSRSVSSARPVVSDLFLMPFDANKLYWVGRSCHSFQQGNFKKQVCDIVFELSLLDKRYQVHSDELEAMGYQIFSASYCYARLTDNEGNKKQVYCKPQEIKEDDNGYKQPYQVNAGLIANNTDENATDKPDATKKL